jgi:hypothetical protein
MATRRPAQPERQLSIGRARCRGFLCRGVRRRAILRAPDKVGRDGPPLVNQSNCCAERYTVDILKHGSAGHSKCHLGRMNWLRVVCLAV